MAQRSKQPLNSHDDPVVIDNGPFRLDLRGQMKLPRRPSADEDVAARQFTFFSQLLIGVIGAEDFEPPEVVRLARTPAVVFHLKDNRATATFTLRWKQGGDTNEPYQNSLIASVSGIELEDDQAKRLKAKDTFKNFRIVRIEQGGSVVWRRGGSNGTLLIVLVAETEPGRH